MVKEKRAYFQLHLAVFLFGFTAILGDLIDLPATSIVWWRVFMTSLSLLFLVNLKKLFSTLPRKLFFTYMGIGIIVGIHWVTFYGAIKLSNASITLICFATTSFFTAIVEPIILKKRFKFSELVLGALIIPGMILIVSDLRGGMLLGMSVGIFSAFLASLFSILNKKFIREADELSITFLELSSAWLFMSIVLILNKWVGLDDSPFMPRTLNDIIYLMVLSLVCTTFAYVLVLKALKHLSAFASNLTFNMEPIYGITFAWLILGDHKELTPNFYLGVLIVVLVIFSYPLMKNRIK